MKALALITVFLLSLPLPSFAYEQALVGSVTKSDVSQSLRSNLPQGESNIMLAPLNLPPVKERLLTPEPQRPDSFGNSRVDLAPKVWPNPMVVSPGRPVLPGSAW